MNKPVNKKIAILLKEKGWKRDCKNYYTLLKDTLKQSKGTNLQKSERIQAPIISNVAMWLLKKHEIWISVFSTDDISMFSYKISSKKGHNYSPNFNSPTEAYEAAIEYTLKHLL